VIKGPVTKHLPPGSRRIGFCERAALVPIHEFVARSLPDAVPTVFVVGAFAHGVIDSSYVDEEVAISSYSLSAAYALARITNAMEMKWGIV
jgi:rRNA small subunit pseudouridine methyltransferase Nep1